MTTTIRYEVRVLVGVPMDHAEAERLVREALLTERLAFYPRRVSVFDDENGHPEVFVTGEEDDWFREDETRHQLVREAVVAAIPTARVSSSWMNMDDPPWDSTFEHDDVTDDDEGDEESADETVNAPVAS